jgi:Cu/Ag efflux pump CusA
MVLVFAASLWLFTRLGEEFIPELDEGTETLQMIRSASAGLADVGSGPLAGRRWPRPFTFA